MLLSFYRLVFAISAISVVYLFSYQGKSKINPILHSILSVQGTAVRDGIYKNTPWLKSYIGQGKSAAEPEAVVRTSANLREGPSLEANVIRVLNRGVRVHVVEVRDDWGRVTIDGPEGRSGWIRNSLLGASK